MHKPQGKKSDGIFTSVRLILIKYPVMLFKVCLNGILPFGIYKTILQKFFIKAKIPQTSCLRDLHGSPNWARTSDIMINSHALYRLSYGGIKKKREKQKLFSILKSRRLPILPGGCPPSIVGEDELNYCVRQGNRWDLIAIITD